MNDERKTKAQLSAELQALRQRVIELETAETARQQLEAERQRLHAALQASETRYRRLFETAQDGILLLDAATGQITDVNPFLEQLLGYSHTELIGQHLWEIGPFKDVAESKLAFEQLQTNEYIRYEDLPLETRAGQRIEVEFVSNVYRINGGKVIQCNVRDITARYQVEKALQASETRYRRLFETAQDGILLLDAATGQITDVNPFLEQLLGYSHTELIGQYLWEIGPFKDVAESKLAFEQLQTNEYIRYEDLPLETRDGQRIEVEFVSNVYRINGDKVIQCNVRDITARYQVEKALQASETRYRRLFETAQDGILLLDAATGQITDVNPFLEKLLGYSHVELIGQHLWEIGPFKDVAESKLAFEQLQTNEYIRYEDLPLETRAGQRIEVEFVSNVYRINGGKVIQCNVRDITARYQAEKALQASQEQFRIAQDMSPDGFTILRPVRDSQERIVDFTWIYENAAVARLNGTDPEAVVGQRLLELFPGHRGTPFLKAYLQVAESGESCIFEADFSGESLPESTSFRIVVVPMAGDIAILAQDITKRKRAEQALFESRAILQAALDQSPAGIAIADAPDGKLRYVNDAGLLIRGGDRQSIVDGVGIEQYVASWQMLDLDGTLLQPDKVPLARAVLYGETNSREFIVRRTRNDDRIVLGNAAPILNEAGQVVAGIVVFTDITERKRAEKALRESEREFRILAESMPQIVWVCLPDGKNIYFNQQWVDYTGLTLEESYGDGWNRPFHPDDRQRAWEAWENATKHGAVYALECRLRRADGAYTWWLIRGAPLLDAQGVVLKWFGTCTDIHALKQAEEARRQSEARLRAILDATPFPIALVDLQDDNIDFWSRSALTLFGHTAPTTTEWYQIAYPDPDYRREVIDRWKPFLEIAQQSSQAVNTGEYRVTCHDGSVRICELYAAFLADRLIVTFNDITERKQAEEKIRNLNAELEQRVTERTVQLRTVNTQLENELLERKRAQEALLESEDRFRRLSEAAFEAIIIHDGGILLNTNNQYCEMFGYEPEELLGKQVMPLTIAPDSIETVKKKIAAGGMGPYEAIGQKKDGTRFPMEIRVRMMEYKGHKARVAAIMDITERKRTMEALLQRTAQLEAANQELETFSYSVSHDLRAPLRGIDGWSLALLEDYGSQLDAQARQYLERVRSETQRMAQLIDDLLQLSRVTRANMQEDPVDLSALAQTIAARLQAAQPTRQFETIIQADLVARGDAHLLGIALTNLLDNAAKFTGPRPLARIEFGLTQVKGQPAYFIRDNGVGFDPAYARNLFGAFQRMHRQSEFPGTGIGLATVQRIIHRHGGRIWAEAAVDQGATFYFTLEVAT